MQRLRARLSCKRRQCCKGEIADVRPGRDHAQATASVICTLANDYRTLARAGRCCWRFSTRRAFMRDETSSTPDIEAARALLPGLSTTRGMLVVLELAVSSGRVAVRTAPRLFRQGRRRHSRRGGCRRRMFNPTLDVALIEARERERSAGGALANGLASFGAISRSFWTTHRSTPRSIVAGRLNCRRAMASLMSAFADASRRAGTTASPLHRAHRKASGSSPTWCAGGSRPLIRRVSPLNLRRWRNRTVAALSPATITRPVGSRAHSQAGGVEYRRSALTRSELYLEGLPLFSRGLVQHPRQRDAVARAALAGTPHRAIGQG